MQEILDALNWAAGGIAETISATSICGRNLTSESNHQVVERFLQGLVARDFDVQTEACAGDLVVESPQSGERIRGWAIFGR